MGVGGCRDWRFKWSGKMNCWHTSFPLKSIFTMLYPRAHTCAHAHTQSKNSSFFPLAQSPTSSEWLCDPPKAGFTWFLLFTIFLSLSTVPLFALMRSWHHPHHHCFLARCYSGIIPGSPQSKPMRYYYCHCTTGEMGHWRHSGTCPRLHS